MARDLPAYVWLERCARRISQLEQDIAEAESRKIARDLHSFERTRAMDPEAAVDFVAAALADPARQPFERRQSHRA